MQVIPCHTRPNHSLETIGLPGWPAGMPGFRAKGAGTHQPRAERTGALGSDSPTHIVALQGQNSDARHTLSGLASLGVAGS